MAFKGHVGTIFKKLEGEELKDYQEKEKSKADL